MKKSTVILLPSLLFSVSMMAQDSIYVHKTDGSVVGFPMSAVDTMVSSPSEQKIMLSYPESELESFSFSPQIPESEVNLNQADRLQSCNILMKVSFLKKDNPSLLGDVSVSAYGDSELMMVIPYLSDLSSLSPDFSSTGSFVYVNGIKWTEGQKMNFTEVATLKIVAFNGDVRTYTLTVKNSGLPVVEISTPGAVEVGTDWTENATMKISSSSLGVMELKGKGSHFAPALKNSYNLKFDNKTSLLGITKNKRWTLVSNDVDKTLMRAALAYAVGSKYMSFDWTPSVKPVELVLNGTYLGNYFLTEQVRVCQGRIEDGHVLSVEESADEGEDAFVASASGKLFVVKDPETGSVGTGLLRSKDVIDHFESVLFATSFRDADSGYRSLIDMNSFVDWFLMNEMAKNQDAFISDCYLTITGSKILKMGPVSDMAKSFGNEDDDVAGFVSKESPWMARLFEDPEFVSLVKSRFAKIYAAKSDILNWIDSEAETLRMSVAGNEMVWRRLGAQPNEADAADVLYQKEVKGLKTWMEGRLEWLNGELQ